MPVTPFEIAVPENVLEDLRRRLAGMRWPDAVQGAGWDYGTDLDYLQQLVVYWQNQFDWRTIERQLNAIPQFRAQVNGFGLHFLHVRGRGPKPLPLLLSHGFPDSFLRMIKLIPLLTDPAAHGGDAADAFDVIVPSLPGFGFSDKPSVRGFTVDRIAALFDELMTSTLGYARYAAHGGDWGSVITERLALSHPQKLLGIHMTEVPFSRLLFSAPRTDLSEAEQRYLDAGRTWQRNESGYQVIQSTKPQTLAMGLNDSPVGLASWIVEKYRGWSDCAGDVERCFSKDELLANITLYWVTQTIHSAMRTYYEGRERPKALDKNVEIPTGIAIFPKDLRPAPREFGERFFDIQHWTQMPRGGHFAAQEEPELLAADLRLFFRALRRSA